MALVLKDRVKQQTTTTGQGTITLSGSFTGFQDFSVIGNGNVTYYTIYDPSTGDWEVGYGTYTSSGTTLSRTVVYDSSVGAGNKVNFQAGTKIVFCTQPAEQAVYQETNGNVELIGGVIGLSQDGTFGTTLPNTSFQAFTTGNYYMQANQQNLSSGTEASSDWICTANNGTDTENYIDVGMASSGYNYTEYSAQKANSGYVMSTGADLRLIAGKYGAVTPGGQDIVLIAGSTKDTEERVRVYGDTGNVNIGGGVNATDTGQRLQVAGSANISGAATFGSTVTLSAAPTLALQAATKQYVDTQTSTGIHIHTPCASETSAALSAVYTQGGTTFDITDITGTDTVVTSTTHGLSVNDEIWLTTTAGNGLSINTPYFVYDTPTTTSLQLSESFGGELLTGLTNASGLTYATRANSGVGAYLEASANEELPIAGVSVSDRVLVYQQATGYWNGVYTVTSLGAADPGGSKWKLTRATDANKYEPSNTMGMGAGDYFFIQSNSESYVLTNPTGPIIIGYDAITYTLFSSVPSYIVDPPLSLVGNELSLGVVPVDLGGTNFSSYTSGDMIYATASTTLNKLSVGSAGQTIISAGGLPTWGALDLAGSGVSGVLDETNGGTGQNAYATGDTLYSSATNTLAKLSGNTTTTRKFMSQTGTGSASAAPIWDTVAASDITSGTLSVDHGGTGLSSYSIGDIVYASGTGTLSGLADAATGNVLLSGGINTAPSYGKVGLSTHVSGTLPVTNGGTGLSSISALSIPVANTLNTYTTVTPGSGQSVRINAGGTAWEAYTPSTGTVTSVTGTSPVASSGGATPAISLSSGYGDTQNPYASKTANYFLAAPNGSSGTPSFRAMVAGDLPTVTVAKGGTALTTIPAYSILVANALDTYTTVTPSAGQSIRLNAGGSAWEAYTPSSATGTVTSVSGTGSVNGITLSGTVTSSGSLTLGGSLSGVSLASQVSGTLPVANGGTGVTSSTGTTAVVLSTTPTITGLRETKVAVAASDINLSSGNYFSKTITATTTFTVSNVPTTGTAASFILDLTNGGSQTVNYWGVKWAGGTAPTLTAAGRDVLGFFTYDGGTTWSGFVLGKDVK